MKLTVQHQHTSTTFTCQLQAPGGTIGRGAQNDLDLPDHSGEISSLQAIIRIDENRKGATLLNMSSKGRVAVNDTLLGLSQETFVNEGDRIQVCDYLIVVEKQQAAVAPETLNDAPLSATPYDTAAFSGTAATATVFASPGSSSGDVPTPSAPATSHPEQLPTWHPAYQPAAASSTSAEQGEDPFPDEHPLGTPINRMPPATPAVTTTVAPMPGTPAAEQPQQGNAPAPAQQAGEPAPVAPPVPEDDPDDIFKDLLSGPGVLPVGGAATDDRHPFDMESATNRNHHNPVELLKPEGLHHPSIDGDPLQALPTDGAEQDRQTIFTDDSPTTLRSDTALDSHKEDNILDTLHRAVHAGYKEKDKQGR